MKAVKLLLTSLTVCSVTCVRVEPDVAKIDDIAAKSLFDYSFKDDLEKFKYTLRCGSPTLGIPSLAPFYIESLEIKHPGAMLSVQGDVHNFTVAGLDGYTVDDATINMFSLSGSIDMTFPQLSLRSLYNIDLLAYDIVPVMFGHGKLGLELNDVTIKASGGLSVIVGSGRLNLSSFSFSLDVGSVDSDTTGLYNSTFVSDLFNSACEKTLSLIFGFTKSKIKSYIETAVITKANEYFSALSWNDFLRGIGDKPEAPFVDPVTGELVCPQSKDEAKFENGGESYDSKYENYITKILSGAYNLLDFYKKK
ncbi:hypothetical protein Bhyg_15028 [Pseudolycoriella hygida]|uniref:Uncharacterized protein n=1 Tax=Pseudolycoriella hygida TaxID=35572 RepID=A0A9Q0MR28_9DIPT|nr:hypothetical protein Bhyg_15028 [Pseudolycoriella hygida]